MLGPGWDVRDLTSLSNAPSVQETGSTFAENAAIKAIAISRMVTGLVLADDSGLEVDVLDGAPGVHSARFAGDNASDAQNRSKLIGILKELGLSQFTARFQCEMVLASQGEMLSPFSGKVEGIVVPVERGTGGFGYDSMFIPVGYQQTFAELRPEIKNSLSHRARALAEVLAFLRS